MVIIISKNAEKMSLINKYSVKNSKLMILNLHDLPVAVLNLKLVIWKIQTIAISSSPEYTINHYKILNIEANDTIINLQVCIHISSFTFKSSVIRTVNRYEKSVYSTSIEFDC